MNIEDRIADDQTAQDFVEPNPFGRGDEPACLVADDQTAQDLVDQAAANGLAKPELLAAIQALYGDADEAIDWPDFVEPNPFGRGDEGEPSHPLHQEFYDKLKVALYEMPCVEDSVSYEDAKDAFSRLLEEEFNV